MRSRGGRRERRGPAAARSAAAMPAFRQVGEKQLPQEVVFMAWSPKRDLIALANRAGEVSAGGGRAAGPGSGSPRPRWRPLLWADRRGSEEGRAAAARRKALPPLSCGRRDAFAVVGGEILVSLAVRVGIAVFLSSFLSSFLFYFLISRQIRW